MYAAGVVACSAQHRFDVWVGSHGRVVRPVSLSGTTPRPLHRPTRLGTRAVTRRHSTRCCPCAQGSFGHVDLVVVTLPGGGQFRAARKRMLINDDNRYAFEAEIQGLREGLGCADIVQLYDYRTTDTHFELLLELLEGGSVEQELVGAGGRGGVAREGRVSAWGREGLPGRAGGSRRGVAQCSTGTLHAGPSGAV